MISCLLRLFCCLNEVKMRFPATEVVLLFELGGNEVSIIL